MQAKTQSDSWAMWIQAGALVCLTVAAGVTTLLIS
jgi:hypothetical protein